MPYCLNINLSYDNFSIACYYFQFEKACTVVQFNNNINSL